MGKPKEFKMPKGKILMGKKTPEPTPTQLNVRKRNPRQPIGGPGVGKPKPVKPTPKGKVFERKLEDNSQKGYGAKPGGKTPMPKPKGKTKPVMPRRGGK